MAVPSPADAPQYTAAELLDEIERRGGRVHRMPEVAVFCLTTDQTLAAWLLERGAVAYKPPSGPESGSGYLRTREGTREWDLYIHRLAVTGEETIHQAAGRRRDDAA